MSKNLQKITVFQQNGSADRKVSGITKQAPDTIQLEIISINGSFPDFIDDSSEILPLHIEADLVLNFLQHPDLSQDLIKICENNKIPVISSGKKKNVAWGFNPPTCCGLIKDDSLGTYGELFGSPEFSVTITNNIISHIEIIRGASCGATWEAARKVTGLSIEEARHRIGLETQFFCFADPANWDPICGKSPVHFAGNIHAKALQKALENSLSKDSIKN